MSYIYFICVGVLCENVVPKDARLDAPKSTSQDRPQTIELPEFVRVPIRQTISVRDPLQLEHVGNRD
jgi:hypothetical protein